ncbi:hypothetical protein D9757_005999 [Collybiopsis confluens]|uniref:Uncharacterized protein n=1 Tax=Collybiopsis confluens TaxID=2823264 RepID=A0A8H5MD96_9AGAR|nr:hypothetical protein D9757_005999 [Collybiopsis confluens]
MNQFMFRVAPVEKLNRGVPAHRRQSCSYSSLLTCPNKIVECGLRQKSYSVADILSNNIPDTIPPITVLWRERSDSDRKIRRYTYLSEYEGPEQLTGKRIERTTDYDMIYLHNDESHIVLSGSPDKFEVELMALRQVPTGDGLYSEGLMSFLSQAVDAARDVRRNIRPTHDGVMNQIGLNMGPRHCRVFGAAKSFTKKLTDEQMISHDHDIIGAVSVFWAICQAILPEDIRSTINQYMEDEQLPALQTRNVEPGREAFFFPYAPRAPPEAYINKGYGAPTHTDPTYCCFALAFIVRRVIDRSHPARQGAKALQDHMGGNYVDVRLGVIVASAAGTILAFKPGEMHATTLSHGACNYGYAITFSRRLADGYRESSGEKKADYFIKSEEIVSHA